MNRVDQIIEATESELNFKTARAGGSGGQHVNKVETKVFLEWDFMHSPHLTEKEKSKLKEKLQSFLVKDNILQLQSQNERSQILNKKIVIKRWKRLVRKAFQKEKKRIKTKPTKSSNRKRLEKKSERSEIKKMRKKPNLRDMT